MRKRIVFALFLIESVGMLTLVAAAQSPAVKVQVPFRFMVGEKQFVAGEYVFSALKDGVTVEQRNGTRLMMTLANHLSGTSPSNKGQVVFQCYDEECFLSQVWIPGQEDGRQVLRSHTEGRVAEKKSGKYMALLGSK